jgi:pilus assembly protein TadC
MTLDDIILLGKKILIGIIVTMIPFLILLGGLWFTQKLLQQPSDAKPKTVSHSSP